MTFIQFVKLIIHNLKWLMGISIMMASLIYFVTKEGPSEYTSHALVYTGLASGYSLESQENMKVDYFSVNNAFDNLIKLIDSRETRTEVGIRLLASHLSLTKPDTFYLSTIHYQELNEAVGDSLKKKVLGKTYEETVLNIYKIKEQHIPNAIYKLLTEEKSIYSVNKISEAKFSRVLSSDMIEGKYTCDDPGICKQVLDILIEVFSNRHRFLKEGETDNVVAFFEAESNKVFHKLTEQENELKTFQEQNQIINYYEQTKYISSKKEDLDEQVSNEKMRLAGAISSVQRIEKELAHRDITEVNGKNFVKYRADLSQYIKALGMQEAKEDKDERLIKKLQFKVDSLKQLLRNNVETLYLQEHSLDGLPIKTLLEEWLQNVIVVEESTSKAEILEERRADFENTYNRFAPLGSALKRYDRKINVIEQEYLQLLHSLNLSRMRKQNIAMSAGLDVIDPPFYPIEPLPSKRKLLIAVGGIVGFVLTLVILLVLEFFDYTIKTEQRAKEQIGLDVMGGYPLIPIKIPSNINYQYVTNRLIQLSSQQIRKYSGLNLKQNPYIVLFFSMKKEEGKTTMMLKILEYLREINGKALALSPHYIAQEENEKRSEYLKQHPHVDNYQYEIPINFSEVQSYQQLIQEVHLLNRINEYHYVFLEVPALLEYDAPIYLMKQAQKSVLLAKANRVWTKADERMLSHILEYFQTEPVIFLNGMKLDFLEDIIGEVPKGRSYIRYLLKRAAKFDFKSRTKFV